MKNDDLQKSNLENGNKYSSKDKVVVITGASSGIGRAAAHEFARRGSKVVVSARNKKALGEVVKECRKLDGEAIAIIADVTREDDVDNLARSAVEKYGRIDIWINNAAVTLFGRFEEVPTGDIRRVVETNLFGYIYGARAAIPRFREQGSGTLINISSAAAVMGQPYTGAYVATKAAEKALSESLNQELIDEKDIHVCTVLPGVTDTPIFQHGANYTGKKVTPPGSVYPPEKVAEAIADLSENPKKEIYTGSAGQIISIVKAIAPSRFYDKLIKDNISNNHFDNLPAESSSGNLYKHDDLANLTGGWQEEQLEKTRFEKRQKAGMMLAGLGLGLLAVWGLTRSKGNGHS
jgi:short-subunit dehydrogenase